MATGWATQRELWDDIALISRWGERDPDDYAGFWLDSRDAEGEPADLRITVAVVKDPAASRQAIVKLVQHPDAIEVVSRRWTH